MGPASITCVRFKYGYDPAGTGSVTQVIGDDTFGPSALNVQPVYDPAGNLTDDGIYVYGYDAWNRLVSVKRKAAGAGDAYAAVATYRYDGLGRRIYKKVANSGSLNGEQYFYYNNRWQLLEVDNGSGAARQQFVWGTNYIGGSVGDITRFLDSRRQDDSAIAF